MIRKDIHNPKATRFTNNRRFEVDKDGPRDMLSTLGLGEEGVERVVRDPLRFVARHLTIRVNPVLETVELPAGIAHLDPGLSDVDGDDLAHFHREGWCEFDVFH